MRYEPLEFIATPELWGAAQQNPPRRRRTTFGDFDGLEVRLALLRSPNYDPKNKPTITGSKVLVDLVTSLQHEAVEEMLTILVNTKLRVTGIYVANRGQIAGVGSLPIDVLRAAVAANSPAFFMIHNHPSGDATPSSTDFALTHRVAIAAYALGIELLDHVVIGLDSWTSLADQGKIPTTTDLNHVVARAMETFR